MLRYEIMATVFETLAGQRSHDPDSVPGRPRLAFFLREVLAFVRWKFSHEGLPAAARSHNGKGRPVMLIPGFFASDISMAPLRNTLKACNYRAFGWRQGINWGVKKDTFERLERELERVHSKAGRPVALIGWSMGGVMARELAKCRPDLVERVVTLGSPFSGDPRANRIWWLYELIAGHKVDAPPIECTPEEKPPVETVAIWSRQDGVIAPACARGRPGEVDRAIEIESTHLGFASAPKALRATLAALES